MLVGTYQHWQRSSLIDLLVELAEYYDIPHPGTSSEVAAHLDDNLAAPGSPITLVTAIHLRDGRHVES